MNIKTSIKLIVIAFIFYILLIISICSLLLGLVRISASENENATLTVSKDTFQIPMKRGYVTSEFGQRENDFHTGIDLSSGLAANIYAAAEGVVYTTYTEICGGNIVVIHHNISNAKYTTLYAHLSVINVTPGQKVTKETIIGKEGSTGRCVTGPHLHLEVYSGLKGVDYQNSQGYLHYLNPRQIIDFPYTGGYFNYE